MTVVEPKQVTGATGAPLTVVEPTTPARAAVLVIQEAWGVTDHLVGQAAELAGRGFLAVVPHLYHRADDPVITNQDIDEAKTYLRGLRGPEIEADVIDAAGYAVDRGVPAVGIVGFCMGGTVALWAAARGPVDAAVTFYGGGVSESRWPGIPAGLEMAAEITVPWLGLYGEEDRSIPLAELDDLRARLSDNPVPTEIVTYPGAGHAFATDPGSALHRKDAARDGWARAITWLEAHLT